MAPTKEPATIEEINEEIMGHRNAMKGGLTPANKHVYERVRKLIELRDEMEEKRTKTGRYDPRYVLIKPILDPTNAKNPTKRIVIKSEAEAKKICESLAHYLGGYETKKLPDGRIEVGSLGYYYYIGA